MKSLSFTTGTARRWVSTSRRFWGFLVSTHPTSSPISHDIDYAVDLGAAREVRRRRSKFSPAPVLRLLNPSEVFQQLSPADDRVKPVRARSRRRTLRAFDRRHVHGDREAPRPQGAAEVSSRCRRRIDRRIGRIGDAVLAGDGRALHRVRDRVERESHQATRGRNSGQGVAGKVAQTKQPQLITSAGRRTVLQRRRANGSTSASAISCPA